MPVGLNNGAVNWDLSKIQFDYEYYPFYRVEPNDGQCPINRYNLLDTRGNYLQSQYIATNGLNIRVNTTQATTHKFLIQASTTGYVSSEKVMVTMGVCARNSLSRASTETISRVIERYSSNVYNRDLPNTHLIEFYKWSSLFKNACLACTPKFAIVS